MDSVVGRPLAARLELFDITARDVGTLGRHRALVLDAVPALMRRFDAIPNAGAWGELSRPVFWEHREDYWLRMATGQLDEVFVAAARRFARTTHGLAIPGDSFTARNAAAGRFLVDWMFDRPHRAVTRWLVPRPVYRCAAAQRRHDYASALQKSMWFGLSIVLEAYDTAEREKKDESLAAIEASFATKIGDVSDLLGRQVVNLEQAVGLISGFADRSTQSAEMINDDARKASDATARIAQSADDLARSVGQIGRMTHDCAETAQHAAQQARLGEGVMARFFVSSRVITEITGFINQVADRTRLLALNATIEAARAGPAGRGFAVVADEVRNLARETSDATRRVTQQVSLIHGSTEEAAAAIHALAQSIEDVSAITAQIAAAVLEQDMATRAIALSVQQAAVGNAHVSGLTGAMKTETDQSRALASSLSHAAAGIGLQSTTVQGITQGFMGEIRRVMGVF